MNQENELKINDIIQLPSLEYIQSQRLGSIKHVLKERTKFKISSIQDISISRVTKLPLYYLSDGQKIIIATKKVNKIPDNIDGILLAVSEGIYKWLYNKELEMFNSKVKSKGLNFINFIIKFVKSII